MPQKNLLTPETSSMPCKLCGNNQVYVIARLSRSGTALRSVICSDCGLVWSDPFPHNPRQFYEKDYRLEYKNTYIPKPKHVLRAGNIALTRLEKIKQLLGTSKTILDVGTGGGEFAYLLKSLCHDVHGTEPNRGYAEYSKAEYGLNLHIGFIQDSHYPPASFDVITIWHVLEHTEDPYIVLQKLHSLLKADGVLVVEVPNIEACCQAPKSTFHEAHLFNFNLKSLIKMGEKAGLLGDSHLISADGGNITVFFRKNAGAILTSDFRISDNAAYIMHQMQQHTCLKHYLSAKPYQRLLKRLCRSAAEINCIKGFDSNKGLLDQLYQAHNKL